MKEKWEMRDERRYDVFRLSVERDHGPTAVEVLEHWRRSRNERFCG
jgi:hypothetical protein